MKPTLLTLTALGALAAASPAAAQTYNGYGYGNGYYGNNSQYQNGYSGQAYDSRYGNNGYNQGWEAQLSSSTAIDTRIARLDQRLQAGVRSGTIDRYEADRLRAELHDLRVLSRRYAYGGLTASERADLAARLRSVRDDIRTADNGSWDRYDRDNWGGATGYGYNNGDGSSYNNNGYGGAYSNNGYSGSYSNGYATSGTGYGSYNNGYNGYNGSSGRGYYGQGGPYEEVDQACQSRGGIGGLIDNVVGRDNCSTTLRVGERVSSGLYAVPDELRNQYRDSWNTYYRSDGRAIYQIDTRTNTVVRVYPMNR